ncbi:hypothetical protein BTB_502p03770 (plasmid) [Bacillus thuringiensis Bt407]|uniref:Uncharacterized protein n=4 Tax=Bacillaceae TaxID=186817 RepID=A0AAP4Q6L1_BACTU|nr:hypothetical protein [Bacillus thuringiensis]AFV21682.1 hypothetical protein BTB_502p03770 [Bacillus thuringiensis Bt407]ERI01142.1 hypothetical protein BTCBT_002697 [Bacillus thuringiensis T01-328]PQZ77983.1 hypothetical protein CQ064_09035 [Bacillus sp. MYb78]EEM25289.1 hypothetical protein bthur0002_59310 [Bacillus thuringiensis Bt407]MBN6707896.1 hypothetical protein [Bacillus thuringiensis]
MQEMGEKAMFDAEVVENPFIIILFIVLVGLCKVFYATNAFAFYIVITALLSIILGTIYFIYKKEYNRIKQRDMDRVKATLTRFLRTKYSTMSQINSFFVLMEEEKYVSKITILKRCFKSYQLTLTTFIPSGELLCSVTVSENKVDIDEVREISMLDLKKELYVNK